MFCDSQIIAFTKEEMKKASLSEQTMISIIWTSVMSCVEWNKKEELVTEQAIKHLKVPGSTWAHQEVVSLGRPELMIGPA